MLINLIKGDRFSLVVLALTLAAGVMWYLRPQLAWLPLLVAMAPWLIRMAVGVFPFQPSWLDLPMALFMATAASGLWLSYDQPAAQAKYWLLIGAVLLYYALGIQSRENLWILAGFLTLLGIGVGAYFLMTHDWQTQPARLEFFNQMGLRWMSIRPALGIDNIHPNVAAGLTAIASPFAIAIALRGLRSGEVWRKKFIGLLFAAASAGFFLFVLLLTASRGAWLALGIALVLWLAWEGCSLMADLRHINPRLLFFVALLSLAAIGAFIVLTYPGGPTALVNRLPGPSNVESRAVLVRDTLHLIGDYPIIGAGLASFPGLYSNYILILPSFVLGHSHNLLLDITLEQGPLGLIAFLGVWLGCLILLLQPRTNERRIRHFSLLRLATTSSLFVLLLHGLIDDPLYGSRAVLFLFMIPGTAVAVARSRSWEKSKNNKHGLLSRLNFRTVGVSLALVFTIVFILAVLNWNTISSEWHANLGAVEMARVELANWPTDQWDNGQNVTSLAPAEGVFNKALALNSFNGTAHYRLGLIAMLRRSYAEAVGHLEAAHQMEPTHQGIQKSLGYSYAWAGDFDKAFAQLRTIQESVQELNIYVNWWAEQGRPDLSSNAAVMEQRLQQ